jgi:hypothetical protein
MAETINALPKIPERNTRPGIERVFEEVADFTRSMGALQGSFLTQVKLDIDRFLEQTKSLQGQMQWQGWTTLGLSAFAGSLAIAGALIPKASSVAEQPANMRMNANAGMSDPLTDILKKLGNQEFLRSTCKTTSKFFNGLTNVSDVWYRGKTTEIESKRTLTERVSLQESQGMRGQTDSNVQTAQTAVLRILDSKSKGG